MNAPVVSLDEIRRQIEAARDGHRHGQRGLFSLADLPQRPSVDAIAVKPGWAPLDDLWRLYPGQFSIVTGTPGHGKSTLVLNVVCNIAKLYGWGSYLYVPENEAFLRSKLRRIYGGSDEDFDGFSKYYCFVQSAEIQSYNDEPKTLGWVLDRAIVGIRQDGVRLVVIDPWNELEHAKPRDQAMTDYVRDCLMYLKAFCRAHHVAMIMVAHPTKAHASDNRPPTLYDIEQSAAWFNKSDNGLIVARDQETNQMKVISAKVRERGAGRRGSCLLLVNDDEQVTDLTGLAL
jgi:twinkle protein